MKVDVINLLAQSAEGARYRGAGIVAYSLYELANDLRALMRGEATLDEFRKVYVGADRPPIDIDAKLNGETRA